MLVVKICVGNEDLLPACLPACLRIGVFQATIQLQLCLKSRFEVVANLIPGRICGLLELAHRRTQRGNFVEFSLSSFKVLLLVTL
jgi:hypothetical protein